MVFDELFEFEQALAYYTGAPYAIVTDGCTHAIELCLRYCKVTCCEFTAYTYLSIPMTMRQLGIDYELQDIKWTGEYQFHGTTIWDSARRLEKDMYKPEQMQCLSFGHSKPLQLGKGGAILLDDEKAYKKLSMMRSDGRDLRISPWEAQQEFWPGFHYCPTIELCRAGSERLPSFKDTVQRYTYPDLREIKFTT